MKKITSLFVMAMVAMTMSAQSTRTIYLDANIWQTSDVNPVFAVHVWNTGEDDAADYWFEAVEGTIYKAEIRDDAVSAIFLRKDPADAQVMDLIWGGEWNRSETTIPADQNEYRILSWGSGEGTGEHGEWMNYGDPIAPVADVIVKVKKPAEWPGMNIWAWGSSDAAFNALFPEGTWPGIAMEAIGDDWYQFTVKADAWFLFNNGTGDAQSQAAQAPSAACFNIGTGIDASGHFEVVDADCPDDTAVEEVAVKANASVKKIVNGQLVIMREGKAFNALGAEMK